MYKKFSITFFVLLALLVTQFGWAQSLRNDDSKDEAVITKGEKISLPYQTIYLEGGEDVLFDNGPLVNLPGGGLGGADASVLQSTSLTMTTIGFGHQQNLGNYMADDFVATASWNLDSIKFFAYQTGSSTASTITGVYLQIWDGVPGGGGTVIFGDQTTNRLLATRWSGIYRVTETTLTDGTRGIMEVVADISGLNLPAGTYWVEWGCTGSLASGPWAPPVTIAGQTTTGNGLQNLAGVYGPANDGGTLTQQGLPFIVYGTSGAPCPVGPATNPSPVSGATNVSINPGNATWTNGVGTTQVEVFFGPAGNSVSVYSGTPIESIAIPGPLAYATDYEWKVVCKNDTCSGAPVATWTFTTEQDPNLATLFFDDFEAGSGLWTILNNGGTCVWTVYTPPFPNLYTLPCDPNCGSLLSADSDECGSGTTINSSAVIASPLDISLYSQVDLEFDQDFNDFGGPDEGYVEVSNDGGTTWNIVWQQVGADLRNTHEVVDISTFAALQSSVLIRFRSVQPSWDWWWTIDNVKVTGSGLVPVELVSFAATTNNSDVTLNWSTATELNNSGFQIERSNGSAYEVVGFVAGHGTTTEVRNYNFVDQNVASGTYSYRLKQVDFDGTFEYSNAIEVEVLGVKEFALGQNYPNPFNPSTTINFSLAVDSKVSLKIFDVLGQEVATLLNGQMAAGNQKVSFDASSLNSGVYFYRIDASGVDGQKFSSVKKMILTK